VKSGDVVQYKPWPHEELHMSGLNGLVVGTSYRHELMIDVFWSQPVLRCGKEERLTREFITDLMVLDGTFPRKCEACAEINRNKAR